MTEALELPDPTLGCDRHPAFLGLGGTLYLGALSGPDGPAPTCLDTIRHDATTLGEGLGSR
ncbi:MAG: hypothetical protein F4Y57_00290 [Acidobacteria bacterium]|nr:hypothetical protein [Acidobacteriota bacterium]